MLFTWCYEHTIDAKNRLAMPAQVRNELDPEEDGTRFYVVPGLRVGTLAIYPEKRFRKLAESRPAEPIPDEDELTYDQISFSMASPPLEPDKQGRILLPERTLRLAKIGKQVVVIGVRDHLELWNKKDYEQFVSENWARYSEIQLRARRAMRQSAPEGAPGADRSRQS